MMDWELNYGELSSDTDFVGKCEDLKENMIKLQDILARCLARKKHYDKMSLPDKIELDLFLAYAFNALQWIQLRIQGVDPTKHPIMNEILRVKKVMKRWQDFKDRDKRPKMDKEAAKRFVKSGLYDPKALGAPVNKKIKFNDADKS